MVKLTATEYVVLPDGVYAVKLISVEEQISRDGLDFLRWIFEVVGEPEYAGASLTGATSLRLSPRSKARQWAEALLGRRLERGEELDTDTLIGRTAMATVTTVDRDGVSYNRIESLAPVRRAARPAPEPAPGDLPF